MIQSKRINGVGVNYIIADPLIDDIGVSFKIGATVKDLGQAAAATVAANFNYANNDIGKPTGRVIVGSKTVISDEPKTVARDELYMLPDGSLHIGKAPAGAVWALQGSPPLLSNGVNVVADGIIRDQTGTDIWQRNAYRLAVGLTGTRKLVVARTKHTVSLDTLAVIMLELGCIDALNGDGGGSAYLWPADNGWGRKMGVALTINKGEVKPMVDLKITEDIIPKGRKNRSGYDLKAEYVTIHDTGNKAKTANASNHANYLKGDTAANTPVSWHFTVDDKSIYQHLPTYENGWHAGDGTNGPGNRKSIGIEICENEGINRAVAEANAAKLAAKLLIEHNLTIDRLVQHNKWSGKNCPASFRSAGTWNAFVEKVKKEITALSAIPKEDNKPAEVVEGMKDIAGHWAQGSIVKAIQSGVMVGMSKDEWKPDKPLTRAQLAVVLDRMGLLDVIDRMSESERGDI
ncbi:N-acetylmuramoyl-L-alanine amidase [Paenibacillus sp. GXUN7292]|uniref:N-acetylmuramoyl-L-alanine amidase n=1 Tax=Paenibacillus sp. GXUN7292 TaxID=3422499 RepID=UPI003D7F0675